MTPIHVGIFVEEMRQGNDHADAFHEAFQLHILARDVIPALT